MTAITGANAPIGTELGSRSFPITRADLIAYCGASGDHNVIHWNERIATAVGLPNVIAHGMYTMAVAGRVLTDWAGDPGAVVEYSVRFSAPVVVPDDDAGAALDVSGVVSRVLDDNRVEVDVTASVAGQGVLSRAFAVVQLG